MIAGPSVISDLSTPKSDSAKLDGLAALEAKVDATTERIDRLEDTLVRQQMRSVRAIDEFQAAIGAALETLEEQQQYGSWDGLAGVSTAAAASTQRIGSHDIKQRAQWQCRHSFASKEGPAVLPLAAALAATIPGSQGERMVLTTPTPRDEQTEAQRPRPIPTTVPTSHLRCWSGC